MTIGKYRAPRLPCSARGRAVLVFALLFAWVLAFPFEGQILYARAQDYRIEPHALVFAAVAATFCGLLCCGFFIKSMRAAKRLMLGALPYCALASAVFLFPPSGL